MPPGVFQKRPRQGQKKRPRESRHGFSREFAALGNGAFAGPAFENQRRRKNPGNVLLSHQVALTVPLALEGLTAVFGMGTGVTLPPRSPGKIVSFKGAPAGAHYTGSARFRKPKHRMLRQQQYKRYGQAARPISTRQLKACACARLLYLGPINLVVFQGSSGRLPCGRSHLGGGFTLRCFQRLSLPNVATQRCHWRDNWCTRGSSIPVLSY